MPSSIDILFERLKQFDEVTLLELLDITSEDILERFRDKVVKRQNQLYGEVELINPDDEEEEMDEWDGFQELDMENEYYEIEDEEENE